MVRSNDNSPAFIQIMQETAKYGYKSPETGKRVVALALRKKDAVLLGYGGETAGDIQSTMLSLITCFPACPSARCRIMVCVCRSIA